MGKKTNSKTIFQKKKLNIWNTKYSEKKTNESSLYPYINLEIEKFVKKIFKDNGFLLNCCKINLTESKLQLFVSYVPSLHTLKVLKIYPQLSKSTLFSRNFTNKTLGLSEKKIKNYSKQKINFTIRTKNFLISKINAFEKKYQKTFLNRNSTKDFNQILNYTFEKHKYSKVRRFFYETVQMDVKKLFFVQFKRLKFVKFFSIYFAIIKQEQSKLKTLVYQSLTNHFHFCISTQKSKILKYYLKYVRFITKNELFNQYAALVLSNNNRVFFSKWTKIKISQKINFSKTRSYNFLEKLIESLNIFTPQKLDTIITLHETRANLHDMAFLNKTEQNFIPYFLNKEYQFVFLKKNQLVRKIISQLRQYKNAVFFEETIQLVFLLVYRLNNPKLFTRFIASQFKSKKNHYFFFRFVRKVLSLFLLNRLFKIKSVKMTIKGRINGSKRSKKRSILIGKQMPLMFLDSNIEYSKSTTYGPHGTFGVKVWVNK